MRAYHKRPLLPDSLLGEATVALSSLSLGDSRVAGSGGGANVQVVFLQSPPLGKPRLPAANQHQRMHLRPCCPLNVCLHYFDVLDLDQTNTNHMLSN